MNELTVKYCLPLESVLPNAVMLGNPEEANPIPHEANRVHPKTKIGAACGSGNLSPTSCTSGTMMMAATVWETNVPKTNIMIPKIAKIANME